MLTDLVLQNADRRPDHPALEQDGEILTYRALALAVEDRARRLRAAGLRLDVRAGVAMADTIDHVVTILAVLRTGAILLPVDVRWTPGEKSAVLAAFEAAWLLVDAPDPTLAVPQIVASGLAPGPSGEWPQRAYLPAVLSLSSGTTGLPKGPCVSHRQMAMRFAADWIGLGFLSSDRFLCATPLYFGGGRGFTLTHLIGGATVVLHPPPYDAGELPAVIQATRATSSFFVPTILRRVLASQEVKAADLRTLRLLISSGAALHPEERARVMRTLTPNFYNLYGTTEGGVISLLTPDAPHDVAGSVGRTAVMTRLEIVDDDDVPLPPGEIGHVRHRAPWLPDGFWNNPADTARSFRHGCFYPGDLGRTDENGFLFLTGRSKDMIIRGGINIYPDEIESVLRMHPAVQEAAVVGWPSRERGEEVAAFVILRDDIDLRALREHCRGALAAYKVPLDVFAVDDLPRTSAGKLLKRVLVERLSPL